MRLHLVLSVKIRNDISDDIKLLPLKRFKNKLKSLLIDKYLLQIYHQYIFSGFPLPNTGTLSYFVCCLKFFLLFTSFFSVRLCVVCTCPLTKSFIYNLNKVFQFTFAKVRF